MDLFSDFGLQEDKWEEPSESKAQQLSQSKNQEQPGSKNLELSERKNQELLEEKERRLQEAMLSVKKKYGKNAILKGMNFQEGATARERNKQIGGHKA